eukprot:scaffold36493_cov62-Phaeocystis_antarctica.AAC.4
MHERVFCWRQEADGIRGLRGRGDPRLEGPLGFALVVSCPIRRLLSSFLRWLPRLSSAALFVCPARPPCSLLCSFCVKCGTVCSLALPL